MGDRADRCSPHSSGRGVDDGDKCRTCRLCVELCPVHAFTGVAFDPSDDVEVRFHRRECRDYLDRRGTLFGAPTCGICVYVCPQGWSAKRKKDGQRTTPEFLRRELGDARQLAEASLLPAASR